MFFKEKNILLVSPQKWSHIPVSKHHYSKELAKIGANVFFLEPPNLGSSLRISINETSDGIHTVEWDVPVPAIIKFKLRWLYWKWIRYYLNGLLLEIPDIDVVWNFDNGNYFRINEKLNSAYKIFHPVDKLNSSNDLNLYDLVLSVSPLILSPIQHKKKQLIQHGLRPDFLACMSEKNINRSKSKGKRVGYVGNIGHASFEIDWLERLATNMTDVEFHIWGPTNSKDVKFNRINKLSNVIFHGGLYGPELFTKMSEMNALILLYKRSNIFGMDNSHKVIEYLSTGVPIVGTPLSCYENSNLLYQEETLTDFRNTLESVLKEGYEHNSEDGLEFAKNNTYSHHLQTISKCIES